MHFNNYSNHTGKLFVKFKQLFKQYYRRKSTRALNEIMKVDIARLLNALTLTRHIPILR